MQEMCIPKSTEAPAGGYQHHEPRRLEMLLP